MAKFEPFAESCNWNYELIKEKFCACKKDVNMLKKATFCKKELEEKKNIFPRYKHLPTNYGQIQPFHYYFISLAPEEHRLSLAKQVVEREWTVRRLKEEVVKLNGWQLKKTLIDINVWEFEPPRPPLGSGEFRGNCDGRVPLQVILRYKSDANFVVDPMAGSGTVWDVCERLGIEAYCFDILGRKFHDHVEFGDATQNWKLPRKADVIFIHFPYWNIIRYSKEYLKPEHTLEETDISLLDYNTFLKRAYEVLKRAKENIAENGIIAILLGDVRKQGKLYDLPAEFSKMTQNLFDLFDKICVRAWSGHETSAGYYYGKKPLPFCKLNYETLLIFREPKT